ncbi:MAG TPA: aldehyde dehydrogenase [Thermoanaerobaculia bacterium]|nr:aldehyde dehydrogenase [Thermoanaerobaculia bacterium]
MARRPVALHLPVLRGGAAYRSAEVARLRDLRSGELVAEVSQANAALIARDLGASLAPAAAAARVPESRESRLAAPLGALPLGERLAICRRAAALFAEGELAVGFDGETQAPADYLRDVSATTGLPLTLARANLEKLRATLAGMEEVVAGLTRGLPAAALDSSAPERDAGGAHFQRLADTLGAVLPSNSPGVHGLWLAAPALGVGLALKPGRDEPWTPLRLLRALAAAGCPPAALSFYPTDHAGAAEILLRCGRSLLFGDAATVSPWRGDRRIEVHGPGFSKVIMGADQLAEWPSHLELVASSLLANGGRSCINASGVWLEAVDGAQAASGAGPARGGRSTPAREFAEALARRLAAVEARPLDDPRAELAAWPDPAAARRISEWIDRRLAPGEAEDLTAAARGDRSGGRVVEVDGCTFLLPTLIWVRDADHPLARAELLFPFGAVVEVPRAELPARLGPTLVATVLTADEELRGELLACRDVDHLHLGAVPTWQVSFAQPHEGNLFDLLYRRRALRVAGLGPGLAAPPAPLPQPPALVSAPEGEGR